MKLQIKTLQQKTFIIEAELTESVLDLKKKIEASESFPVASQKIIHSGKILVDDKPLSEYNITEKDFLVVMVTKAVVKTTPAEQASSSTTTSAAPAAKPPVAKSPTPAPSTAAPAPSDSTLATGEEYEKSVQNLVEMGFELDKVKAAMRAAFNNPDRAAEYLMTGIPAGVQESTAPQAAATATPGNVNLFQAAAQAAQASPTAPPSNLFAELRNSPQFQQLRQVIQEQPQLLQPILQSLRQSNPELMTLISQNQDAFLSALAEGEDGVDMGQVGEEMAPNTITITPEEEAAITRLADLGFERSVVIEAFFACDKNEELAANYLFDSATGGDW